MKTLHLSLLVCVCPLGLWAQSVAGAGVVSGAIRDGYGEGIPDTDVVLENQALAVRRTMVTTMDGIFDASGLPPAAGYRLKISRKDFPNWETKEFEVLAGQRLNFEITYTAEAPAAVVEASTALPLVDNTKDSVTSVISRRQLELLPVRDRRAGDLALLAPAVTTTVPLGALTFRADTGSNAFFTDGIWTSNGYPTRKAAPAGPVPQDSVQGLQVLSAAASTEFGHAMGGTVNTVTRSGGNSFHGSLYEYFSNHSLSATDRYSLGNNLFGKRNQGGFGAGGPIYPRKLFFFTNLEFRDAHGKALNRVTSPLIADATGTRVLASNCTATAAQCAAAAKYIQSQMNVLVPRSEHEVTGLARVDFRPSDSNTLTFMANVMHGRAPEGSLGEAVTPDGGLLDNGLTKQDTHYGKIEWIGLPTFKSANELRFSMFHDRVSNQAAKPSLATGNLGITVAGVTLGATQPDSGIMREKRTQLVDNFRVSFASHTVLIGVDWTRTHDWIDSLSNSNGTYIYPSLTAFAQDFSGGAQKNYTLFTQTFGTAARDLHSKEISLYTGDAWQATPRLRATAGVRWSKPYPAQPLYENRTYYQTGIVHSPNVSADPRVGVSYMLDGRSVVRFGFGMFHAPLTGEIIDALYLGNGIYQTSVSVASNQANAPSFPNTLLTAKTIPTGTTNLMYAATKLRNPYTKQTTLSIERNLGLGFTLNASYIGSRGVKLWLANDMNLAEATRTYTYTINDASGRKADTFSTLMWNARADNSYAHIYQVTNGGSSWYRALVLQLHKRMAGGFSLDGSYTWSHAIDDVGGTRVAGSIPTSTYGIDHRADLGSSYNDQRHRAAINWTWQPRILASESPLARYVLNGWELASITTLASSQPATALVLVSGQQFAGLNMAFPGSMNGTGGWQRAAFLPVNHLYADPQYTVNLRVARTLPFTERVAGRLVFEAFNLFNSSFDTGVNTIAYTATGGVLTPVPGVGTGNASHGYPNGTNARNCRLAFRVTF